MQSEDSVRYLIDMQDDEQVYLRLRNVMLRLAESCSRAVEQRSDLAPVLSAALQHAVAKLLLDGETADLIALEAWLHEDSDAERGVRDRFDLHTLDELTTHMLAA